MNAFSVDIRNNILDFPRNSRGPKRRDRAISNAAGNAATTNGATAGQYGSQAAGINSTLTPFLTRQMTNPTGESIKDQGAQLTNALAGSGGVTSGLIGAANKFGAANRNPMGFSSALDAAARIGQQGNAKAGSQVAADNTKVKLGQQADASKELAGLFGTNVDAQLKSQQNQNDSLAQQIAAQKTGWLQNMDQTISALGDAATGAAKVKQAWS